MNGIHKQIIINDICSSFVFYLQNNEHIREQPFHAGRSFVTKIRNSWDMMGMDSVYKAKYERPFSAFDILKDFFFSKAYVS